jgi:hypothetical protein
LGDGGFADVWKATDELDRDVAVKIVRASGAVLSSALAHAKALARTNHPSIVSVISLDTVEDPDSGELVPGIVMELIEGVTLSTRLQGPKFSVDEARKLGVAIATAVAHIHEQGMEHGDLHDANVMVANDKIKVIDLLYTDSLALLSSGSRAQRLRSDQGRLRLLLQHIIAHTAVTTTEVIEFARLVSEKSTALDIRDAFLKVSGGESRTEAEQALTHVYDQFTDEGFISGPEHTANLLLETPQMTTLVLLIRITNGQRYQHKHRDFLLALWGRLSAEEQAAFVAHLAAELDKELPKGGWSTHLRMFRELKHDGWRALTPRFRARLEQLLLKDVLLGRVRADGRRDFDNAGSLGTWTAAFWPYFNQDKRDAFAENILTLLHKDAYTQNYVGRFFLSILPKLAEQTHTTDQMIRALRSAVENEAKLVIDGLENLPKEWVAKIKREKS